MHWNGRQWCIAAAVAAVVAVTGTAGATKHISADIKIPAKMVATLQAANGCDNRGNTIQLDGVLYSDEVGAAVMLSNNKRGTHTAGPYDAVVQFTLSDFGQTTFAKQGSLEDGVTGNPWLALAASLFSSPTVVGRCVQGLDTAAVLDFVLDAHLEFDVSTGDCEQSGGPYVTIDGVLTVGGANVYVFLQNKRTEPNHWDSTSAELGMEVTPNQQISVRKSPHFGGAGGNPYVIVQIADLQPFFLGRCNKI